MQKTVFCNILNVSLLRHASNGVWRNAFFLPERFETIFILSWFFKEKFITFAKYIDCKDYGR